MSDNNTRTEKAERERDEARAESDSWYAANRKVISRVEALAERWRAQGKENTSAYWYRMADELEATLGADSS